jgi:hypothetical protein
MTQKKLNQLVDIPPELIVWVPTEVAAAMLDVSVGEKFNALRYSQRFKEMRIEREPNRFSVDLLKKFGRGEYR